VESRPPRPLFVFPNTPNVVNASRGRGTTGPSAARPNRNSSRTADARLGIRRAKRQSSNAASSSALSMTCSRFGLVPAVIAPHEKVALAFLARHANCINYSIGAKTDTDMATLNFVPFWGRARQGGGFCRVETAPAKAG
jgi:hypothetical protein